MKHMPESLASDAVSYLWVLRENSQEQSGLFTEKLSTSGKM